MEDRITHSTTINRTLRSTWSSLCMFSIHDLYLWVLITTL